MSLAPSEMVAEFSSCVQALIRTLVLSEISDLLVLTEVGVTVCLEADFILNLFAQSMREVPFTPPCPWSAADILLKSSFLSPNPKVQYTGF